MENEEKTDGQVNPNTDKKEEITPKSGEGSKPLFTQEEINAIIADRLKRQEKQFKETLEEEKAKAKLEETERLKLEKDEALQKVKEMETKVKAQVFENVFQKVATEAGVLYADLLLPKIPKDIDTLEDGTPDVKALKTAITGLKESYPNLFKSNSDIGAGAKGTNEVSWDSMSLDEMRKKLIKD